MKVRLEKVRLAFPALFEAKSVANDPTSSPRYSAVFLMDPEDPQVETVREAIEQAAIEKWGQGKAGPAGAKKKLATLYTTDKVCLHDGNTKADTYAGFEGMLFVSAATSGEGPAPTVIDRNKLPLTAKSGRPYAGCYVNAIVEIYADDRYQTRVNAQLKGVQFDSDGEAFGGGRPADPDDFETLDEEGAEADDFA